jgi:hypothetical protein
MIKLTVSKGLPLWFLRAGLSFFVGCLCGLPIRAVADAVTEPADYFGFGVGERHLTHAEVYGYLRLLAEQSERVAMEPYAVTHGGRPLVQLLITDTANLSRLDALRQKHLTSVLDGREDPEAPLIISFNYGIHGNEPSASNAAVLFAHYLATTQDPAVLRLLEESVITLDPVLNPDGFDRFANWANAYVGKNANPDPNTLEHNEAWPYGRTNYYFFDLNRDWMLLTQPESVGRLAFYHQWLPHLVLDFHEMGTNSTYFFQPGVPERTHPLIPEATYRLTEEVSAYFAESFDAAGELYFTKERFDDFYPGKGSTVSDLKGAIGILFEQASARGQVQESVNGELGFPHAIANQLRASKAVLAAAIGLRDQLKRHTAAFYAESLELAQQAGFAGYRFTTPGDSARATALATVLRGHDIELWQVGDASWFVPLQQPQFRYIEALFEERTEFAQNLFYDITAWTLPLAMNAEVVREDSIPEAVEPSADAVVLVTSQLGYLIDWQCLNAPRVVLDLLQEDVSVRVAREPFTLSGESFGYGTIFVPISQQAEKAADIHNILQRAVAAHAVRVLPVSSFLTEAGIDLGSNQFFTVERPRFLLAADAPLNPYETGTVWHLLDVQSDYPVTLVRLSQLERMDLAEYTALVLPSGWGRSYSAALAGKLKEWVAEGGVLVCLGNASDWAIQNDLVSDIAIREKEETSDDTDEDVKRRPFAAASDDRALERIRGAIFVTEVDPSHPLAYGIADDTLPVFVETESFMKPSKNAYQTPLVFSPEPLVSGYASEDNLSMMAGSAALVAEVKGKGSIILFGHSPTFRAYWRGTDKLLLNALLFGKYARP